MKILPPKQGGGGVSPRKRSFLEAISVSLGLAILTATACAQGVLTVTPTPTASTLAGTGTAADSGDNGPAAVAAVAAPRGVAYDAAGNIYIADSNNHVVRKISTSGTITTVAGTGVEGYSGDNGPATSAQLDTPLGIAVDASGNLYIADAHNHRIRKVSAAANGQAGSISTIAGTGVSGFSGDGSAATAAQLALPSGVAVDASGNVYIADTNNHRIREVVNGTISTIAGDGEELFAGDGGAATAAALDSPTSVAVGSTGTIYIADRLNQRVRSFTAGSTITTLAGSGGGFAGGFNGDGAAGTSASLARPTGVAVDAAGNVYVADTGNQRVRQVNLQSGAGTITTYAGSGSQGYAGDGGAPSGMVLNNPRGLGTDASGNLAIADAENNRLRGDALPTLSFGNDAVGIASSPQSLTLANTGNTSITVSSVAFTGTYSSGPNGTCSTAPITLTVGTNCTLPVVFLPTNVGPATGSVVLGGTGTSSQKVLLSGTGVQSTSTILVITSVPLALVGQALTLTATVKPAGLGTPTGLVTFYDGTTAIGSSQLSGGSASITLSTLANGTHGVTAVYAGTPNFGGSSSPVLTQLVEDFQLAVSGVSVLSVVPGTSATFGGAITSLNGPFSYPVTLSLTGIPSGAIATFNPPSVNVGTTPSYVTLTVQTPATAMNHTPEVFGGGSAALAFLLMPFFGKLRRRARKLPLLSLGLALLCLAGVTALSGCGSGSGLFGQPPQTYTINLIGTATGTNGSILQHTTSVTLTVQ